MGDLDVHKNAAVVLSWPLVLGASSLPLSTVSLLDQLPLHLPKTDLSWYLDMVCPLIQKRTQGPDVEW